MNNRMPSFVSSILKTGMFISVLHRNVGYSFSTSCVRRIQRTNPSSLFHSSTTCYLNRILFDRSEVVEQEDESMTSPTTVILPKDDYRTIHAAKVLGLHNGDTVRAGLVSCEDHSGLLTDEAVIQWIPEGKVKKAEPLGNGNPPGSIQFRLDELSPPSSSDKLMISLILALPRPLQLGRILPMISQMGVEHLILTSARKVPKDYFGSHLFRKPHVLREKLVEGLCQAGDVRLPQLHVVRNLPRFLDEEMDALFPSDVYARAIAHPERPNKITHTEGDSSSTTSSETTTTLNSAIRMRQIQFPSPNNGKQPCGLVIAIGPEGGWEEPGELELFKSLGFQQVTLGTRTLRSDCAVVSLLSLAHEVCHEHNQQTLQESKDQ